MAALINPEEFECPDGNGGHKVFVLSKFPAVAGREIIAKYPLSGMPKLGDYKVNEETMLKLMAYVAVPQEGRDPLRLTTQALIDNHVADWEMLARIEMEMLKRNCAFFRNGRAFSFLQGIAQQLTPFLSKMLTDLSAQSLKAGKPPSTS